MPGLLDILPRSKKLLLGAGQEVEFFGLSARELAALIKRFPDAKALLGAGLNPIDLIDIFPDLVAAAIATSGRSTRFETVSVENPEAAGEQITIRCAVPATAEEEEAAASLSGADQSLIIGAIAEMSLPGKLAGPFAEMFARADPPNSSTSSSPLPSIS